MPLSQNPFVKSLIRYRWELAAFFLPLLVYAASLAPGVFGWDSAELTLGIYTQGIVHATGYPLYLLLGRLFTLIPISPEFAVRANAFSALCAAITVWLLYRVGLRLVPRQPLAALLAALTFGLAEQIWAQAVVAEVYTLHTALMALILLLVLRWEEGRGMMPHAPTIYLIFFVFGLAFGNHMATLLVAGILLPYLLWFTPDWSKRLIAVVILGVTAALLYLYIPLRAAAHPDFNLLAHYFSRDLRQPGDVIWLVSGGMFGREMFAYPLLGWVGEIGAFVGELWRNFLGVGVVVGLVGIYQLWISRRQFALLLLAIFVAQVLFFTSYRVFDKWTMFHTAYLIWAIFMAVGWGWILARFPQPIVKIFAGLILVVMFAANWNTSGRAADRFVPDRAEAMLAQLPPDATLIGTWTALRPLDYYQIVHNQRPDVHLVDVTLMNLGTRDRLRTGDANVIDAEVHTALCQIVRDASGIAFITNPDLLGSVDYTYTQLRPDLFQIAPRETLSTDCK